MLSQINPIVIVKEKEETLKKGILLIGPLPEPPITGGIATGIKMMLNSRLCRKYNFIFLNRTKEAGSKDSIAKRVKRQFRMVLKLFLLIREYRPQIVHVKTSSYVNFFTSCFYIMIAKCLLRRTILQIHGGGFSSWYDNSSNNKKYFIRLLLHIPDKIFVLSLYWREFLCKITPEKKVVIIPNGVPIEDFKAKSNECNSPYRERDRAIILFIGAPDIKANVDKGIYDVLKAFQYVVEREEGALLILAGFENNLNNTEIFNFIKKEQLESSVRFLGIIHDQIKVDAFSDADIFILPSYYENMPNTILEAMASSLPVVSSPVGAIPELIEEGVNGFLVQPGDYRKLSERIIQLLESPDLRKWMGENNRMKVRRSYDFEIITEMIDREYCKLLEQ